MDIYRLGNLQLSLFLLILIGLFLRKKNIVDEPGKRCLSDVCVYVIIPCNIIKSCLMPSTMNQVIHNRVIAVEERKCSYIIPPIFFFF